MAVGSRQILFSDSAAPAMAGQSPRQVSNMSDNPDLAVGSVPARNEPQASPSTGVSAPASGSSAPPVTVETQPAQPESQPQENPPAVQSEQPAQGGAGSRVDTYA